MVGAPVAPNTVYSAGGPGHITNTGHGTKGAAVCPSRQLVRVLTMVTVGFFNVFEIVLDWRIGGLRITPPHAGCHAAVRRLLSAWNKPS